MRISEDRERPFDAKEMAFKCPDCKKLAVMIFPYKPTAEQRLKVMKEALDEHRKVCPAAPAEKERIYELWYPRK